MSQTGSTRPDPVSLMRARLVAAQSWLDSVDPGTHRRIKGLRLATAYGIAAMLGTMGDITNNVPDAPSLSLLAGVIALWASVSEGRGTRLESSRDLSLLVLAAGLGAAGVALLTPLLAQIGLAMPELVLISGAFCVGYLKRFGLTGAGIGSQIFIGQLLGYSMGLRPHDLPLIGAAIAIAGVASISQRVLSGPAERPPPPPVPLTRRPGAPRPELVMGLQAAAGAIVVVLLNERFGLIESVWAIAACTYVTAGTTTGTVSRVMRRTIGTAIGVGLALAFLPLGTTLPILTWSLAALSMVIYAMSVSQRYDIAMAAYSFALVSTLAVAGEHSLAILGARAWETVLGAALGLVSSLLLLPLRDNQKS